jgi:hypothetical protein
MGKKPRTAVQDNAQAIQPIKLPSDDEAMPVDLAEFFQGIEGDAPHSISVYKNEYNGSRYSRAFVKDYINEVPSLADLGMEFGSGRYEILANYVREDGTKAFKSKSIVLSSHWDKVRRAKEKEEERLQILRETAGRPQENPLSLIKEVMGAIAPILAATQSQNNNQMSTMAPFIQSMATVQGEMMNRSFESTLAMQDRVTKTLNEAREKMGGDGDGDGRVISEIIGALKDVVPLMFSAPRAIVQPIAQRAIAARPDVQDVLSSDGGVKKIMDALNKNFTPKEVDRIVSVIGNVFQAPATGAASAKAPGIPGVQRDAKEKKGPTQKRAGPPA